MGNLYTLGETVYDIIFKDDTIAASRPGGAMLNTAVSLGRLGLPVYFISELGQDAVGKLIAGFLTDNHVAADYIYRFDSHNTALALAFLDQASNATYTFYKSYPAKRLAIPLPPFDTGDILLFGSFAALARELQRPIDRILTAASKADVLLFYDPNFRKPAHADLKGLQQRVKQLIRKADLIRGSHEDFFYLFQARTPEEAWDQVRNAGGRLLVYTQAEQPVHVFTGQAHWQYVTKPLVPVSTIGAGDSFNAGIMAALSMQGVKRAGLAHLEKNEWDEIIRTGLAFAGHVCQSWDNYIATDFARVWLADYPARSKP